MCLKIIIKKEILLPKLLLLVLVNMLLLLLVVVDLLLLVVELLLMLVVVDLLLLVVADLVQAGGQAASHPAGGHLHVPSRPDGSVQRGVHRAPPVRSHKAPRAS